MSTKDISRFLFQPRKRYSSVRMQQGRVILDSDWNESERIDDEEVTVSLEVDGGCLVGPRLVGVVLEKIDDVAAVVEKLGMFEHFGTFAGPRERE